MDQSDRTQQAIFRFAPSPTGFLHVGHAFSALANEARAQDLGGRLLLRIEDIDSSRARDYFVDALREDLDWLGIQVDGDIVFQSQRHAHYENALDTLHQKRLTYRCFCTRSDIRAAIADAGYAPHGPTPHYPGTCRSLTADESAKRAADGESFAWRLNAGKTAQLFGAEQLHWSEIDGPKRGFAPNEIDDIILDRKETRFSYHLAVVVDDALQHVSHVVRGQDLLSSTPVQRLLQMTMGYQEPAYHHHALVVDGNGERYAKRAPGATIRDLRQQGTTPQQIREFFTANQAVTNPVFAAP